MSTNKQQQLYSCFHPPPFFFFFNVTVIEKTAAFKSHLWWIAFCWPGSWVNSGDLSHKLRTAFLHLNVFFPDGSAETNEVPLCWMQRNLKKSLRHRFQGQWCCSSLLAMFETTQKTGTETPYIYGPQRFVYHLPISCLNFLKLMSW